MSFWKIFELHVPPVFKERGDIERQIETSLFWIFALYLFFLSPPLSKQRSWWCGCDEHRGNAISTVAGRLEKSRNVMKMLYSSWTSWCELPFLTVFSNDVGYTRPVVKIWMQAQVLRRQFYETNDEPKEFERFSYFASWIPTKLPELCLFDFHIPFLPVPVFSCRHAPRLLKNWACSVPSSKCAGPNHLNSVASKWNSPTDPASAVHDYLSNHFPRS